MKNLFIVFLICITTFALPNRTWSEEEENDKIQLSYSEAALYAATMMSLSVGATLSISGTASGNAVETLIGIVATTTGIGTCALAFNKSFKK